ncbi:MAG: XRE family transcriptional regulator [Candidatus Eisenbacteria bacterium]
MTLTNATLGKRLKAARENCRLTQEQTAEALGVSRVTVTNMEAGSRAVTTLELARLAKLYQRPAASFLGDADSNEDELLVTLYRKAARLEEDPAARSAVLHYLDLCAEGITLERLLGRDTRTSLPAYELPTPRSALQAIRPGRGRRAQERARLNLGDSPIPSVAEHLSSQGLWVSEVSFPDDLSGFFFNHSSIGIGVLVNQNHHGSRKRFSLAHEYAHALIDRGQKVTATTVANSAELAEKRANAFASAFLLPEGGVLAMLSNLDKGAPSREEYHGYDVATDDGFADTQRNLVREQRVTYREAILVARHFGVSYEAALFRLQNLRILTRPEVDDLRAQSAAASRYARLVGLEDREEVLREVRTRLLQLALDAYAHDEISKGRLVELCDKLGMKPKEKKELLEEADASRAA